MNDVLFEINEIRTKIYKIRGQKVILDKDLSELYQVETKVLNQSVKRNIERFPEKFMFHLNKSEFESLKSQFVTSSWGGTRKHPFAFTEHGTLMVASILKSAVAIQINQKIIEAFISLRKDILQSYEYKLLQETVKGFESRVGKVESDHLIDKTLIATKIKQMSISIEKFSELFNQFQNTHVIIKRPLDGETKG